jgi:hypothetical protein
MQRCFNSPDKKQTSKETEGQIPQLQAEPRVFCPFFVLSASGSRLPAVWPADPEHEKYRISILL